MAARYGGQFYSAYTEQQYSVFIFDEDYTGDVQTVMLQDVAISYPQGEGNRFDTILSARASAKIIINTSDLATFVEDLAGAQEGRFLMQLWKGIAPVFIGYILPDLATEEDTTTAIGGILDLQATDGLARLKTIDYSNNGTAYGGEDTFIAHALKCLNKLTTISGFYPSENYILKTLVNWHSDKYTYSSGIDPLLQSRTPHRAFYSVDSRGNYKFKSCFDVLQEICKAWGCRMFYADYAFWIVQVNEMSADATKTAFVYTKTGGASTESIDFRKDHDQNNPTELIRIAGGVYRFLPPLMKVQVDYRHIQTRNLLAGETFAYDTAPDPFDAGSVDDFGTLARLSVNALITYRAENRDDPPGVVGLWFIFAFRIQVDDLYLDRQVFFTGGVPDYGLTSWTGSTSGRYEIAVYVPENEEDNYYQASFVTPNLPVSGTLIFDVTLDQVFNASGTEYVTPVADYVWAVNNLYVEHLYEGTLDSQSDIRRFVATNDTPDNSAMIELTTIIGDGIGMNSPGHIEVQNDADEWVLSEGWRVGNSGSYVAFSALLAQEIIRGQLTPVRRFQGRYNNYGTSIYSMLNSIDRADGIMLPAGGTFSPAIDDINGEWFFNTPAASGWTLEPFVDIAPDSSGGGGNIGGGSGGGSTGGTTPPVRIYKQSFTGTTSDTVTVTVNGGTMPTNEAGILVFLNQGVLTDDAYTINGADIELTFNLDSSDTLTVIFFIQ
jgi:hypothetical protein